MKSIFILLLVLISISCNSTNEPSEQKVYDKINGEWTVFFDADSNHTYIKAGKDYCYFMGYRYTGFWVNDGFAGTYIRMIAPDFYYNNELDIALNKNSSISGYVKEVYQYHYARRTFSQNFSGLPVKNW